MTDDDHVNQNLDLCNDNQVVATTTTTCTSNNKAAESKSISTKPAARSSFRSLHKIANLKSSLREALGSDGKRNFQHFDSVKQVSLSTSGDVTLNQMTSAGTRQVADIALEMSTTGEAKDGQKNVILKATKQQLLMVKFMEDVMVQLNKLEVLLKGSNEKYKNVLCYCGEDPELSSPDFFSTLRAFCGAFDEAKRYVDRQNRMRLKMKK